VCRPAPPKKIDRVDKGQKSQFQLATAPGTRTAKKRGMKMSAIRINRKSDNLAIMAKLLNSVAANYDCRVKYNSSRRRIQFVGEDAYKPHVIEETINLLRLR
jgi:hypothetical protein